VLDKIQYFLFYRIIDLSKECTNVLGVIPNAHPMLQKSRELFFSRFTFLEFFPPMLPKTRKK